MQMEIQNLMTAHLKMHGFNDMMQSVGLSIYLSIYRERERERLREGRKRGERVMAPSYFPEQVGLPLSLPKTMAPSS